MWGFRHMIRVCGVLPPLGSEAHHVSCVVYYIAFFSRDAPARNVNTAAVTGPFVLFVRLTLSYV